ncbi:unnamed protein product [Periconia digitata]|uniref:Uncharacterized protein n=1 Tax=Periconia digitata TaxID=1303443 RepID=A0A9W4XK93_9PLEO|nr:unnamed protein product [Periconia digitata]
MPSSIILPNVGYSEAFAAVSRSRVWRSGAPGFSCQPISCTDFVTGISALKPAVS